ncbi:MAG: nitrogen fixation protein NifZ [Pseudanabaenaceae cyanobacterium SKYGB_i_bin29]|nr:nitrogen fixation protein NifZ [Pseudanabaenaceae cyanobacterium SKYG29]MDW8422222.1 nitrogen fixation protein NifZ [Pseudanabaenaceae cyanobacterium SKYGB_i_bin29]
MARNELDFPPVFELGDKVRLLKLIRNDGTFRGRERGEVLARPGEIGYVIHIGDFLQTFYIYAVHFLELGIVIGCRYNELELVE